LKTDPTTYHRREFLSQCAALPLAASLASIGPQTARGDQADDLQALLELVPRTARYLREPVPESENAWPILLNAKEVIELPDLHEVDGDTTPWDAAVTISPFPRSKGGGLLHDVLLKHDAALRLIDRAAAKTKLQYPEPSGWETFYRDLDDIGHPRVCFMLMMLRAKLAFHEERYADAARDLCDLLRLSQMLACGDGYGVQWLIPVAERSNVLRGLRRMSTERNVPSDVVKRALKSLDEAASRDDGAAQTLRVELCCFGLPILMRIPQTTDIPKLVRGLMKQCVCYNPPKKKRKPPRTVSCMNKESQRS
jgi:hypothetical protein